jgi:Spy/CpxP family protein refolding chaperone
MEIHRPKAVLEAHRTVGGASTSASPKRLLRTETAVNDGSTATWAVEPDARRLFLRRRNMKTKHLLAITLAIAVVIPALAQTPPKPPSAAEIANRQVKTLTTLLSLTSAQQQQALTIYTNAAKAQQTAMDSDKESRENLRTAIKNNDSASIDQVASTMAQTHAQITSIKAKADAAFYQILTAEQQSKLSDLESQHVGLLDGPGGPPPAMGFR